MMNWKKTSLVLLLGVCCWVVAEALECEESNGELVFRTASTEVRVKDARIIGIRNLKSGVELASPATPATAKTGGIGNMIGQKKAMSEIHFPWGEPSMNQNRPAIKTTTLYRFPAARSKLSVRKLPSGVTAVWTGLTDSRKFFPHDSIRLDFSEAPGGILAIRSFGKTAEKGIFSVSVPVENLNGQGKFILPSFGGLEYPAGGEPALIGFQNTGLFYEAKFMAYELNNTSLGYWYEDPEFRPFFIMFERDRKASAFGIEINNLMRFERHDSIETPVLKIGTYDRADWVAAARPYRDWYRKTFAADLARRDSIAWANRINAVSDSGVGSDAVLERIKHLMPAEGVLLHVWQARKLGFTAGIPDYTLRDAYPGEVARAHKHGFKVMCYVCALCAVYKSAAWNRDKVGDFFLTRKNNISNYDGNKNAYDENLVGTLTAAQGKDQFANVKPGKLLYGDPLSKGWRDYYTGIVVNLNQVSGTDANYQDTLGCTSENGNGIIDGMSGAQGNAVLARELAKRPGAPMASEFGPEPIAFAVKWPLNYPQVWGNTAFRAYRIHRQVPLSAFLFGYRPWIPTINAGDDFHKHLISAASDALGGMGMFSASAGMDIRAGFSDHLTLRSKIFIEKQLKPCFPERKFPTNIRAMYKDTGGKVYSYYDDGKLQMMLDPDGKPLYGRVNGANSVKIRGLCLPGWPCADGEGIYGLNPKNSYALFPSGSKPEISLGRLPDGVQVRYYYIAPEYAYIELSGTGQAELSVQLPERFREVYVNDRLSPDRRIAGELPLRIFLSSGKAVAPERTVKVNNASGLAYGPFQDLPQLRRTYAGKTLYHLYGYNSVLLDAVFDVKNADDAVEILIRNVQEKYGNGTILSLHLNGLEVAKFDCHPKKVFDTKLRAWRVPLGKFKGSRVLVTVRSDNKSSSNADMQFASLPVLVKDSAQKFSETFPSLDNPPVSPKKRKVKRPEGKPEKVETVELRSRNIVNGVFTPVGKALNTVQSKIYPIDPEFRYVLSGKFRRVPPKKDTFFFGVIQYDAKGQIYGMHINRLAGTASKLSHKAAAGSSKLMVFDASNWRVGGYAAFGDLPTREFAGPIVNIEQYGGDWGVFLAKPLKKAYEAETVVAQHNQTNTHLYLYAGALSGKLEEYGSEIKWWPGAVRFSVVILGKSPVELKDIKLELYPAKSKK